MSEIKFVVHFRKVERDDLPIVTKRFFDFNSLYRLKFPVPPGFVITTQAYNEFYRGISSKVNKLLENLDIKNNAVVENVAREIQKLFLSSNIPAIFVNKIVEAYESMNVDIGFSEQLKAFDFLKKGDHSPVVIRTAASAPSSDYYENQEFASFLNVKGVNQVLTAIKASWASLFTVNNIKHRIKNELSHDEISCAVIIQKMIRCEKYGVIETSSDMPNNAKIEAVWGYGKTMDEVKPDIYYVDKTNNKVSNSQIVRQMWAYYASDFGKLVRQDLPSNKITMQVLTMAEIISLSNLARNIEEKFGPNYRISFAFEKGEPYILNFDKIFESEEDHIVENPTIIEDIPKESTEPEEMEEFKAPDFVEDMSSIPEASAEEAKEHIENIQTEESLEYHEDVGEHVAEHLNAVEPSDEQEAFTDEKTEEHTYEEALKEVKEEVEEIVNEVERYPPDAPTAEESTTEAEELMADIEAEEVDVSEEDSEEKQEESQNNEEFEEDTEKNEEGKEEKTESDENNENGYIDEDTTEQTVAEENFDYSENIPTKEESQVYLNDQDEQNVEEEIEPNEDYDEKRFNLNEDDKNFFRI